MSFDSHSFKNKSMNLLTDRKSQEKNLKNSLLPKTTIKDPKKFAGSLLTPEAINEIKK